MPLVQSLLTVPKSDVLPSVLRWDDLAQSRYLWVGAVLLVALIIELGLSSSKRTSRLPTLNASGTALTYKEAKNNFIRNARSLLAEGLKKVRNHALRRLLLVLDSHRMEEITMLTPEYLVRRSNHTHHRSRPESRHAAVLRRDSRQV